MDSVVSGGGTGGCDCLRECWRQGRGSCWSPERRGCLAGAGTQPAGPRWGHGGAKVGYVNQENLPPMAYNLMDLQSQNLLNEILIY